MEEDSKTPPVALNDIVVESSEERDADNAGSLTRARSNGLEAARASRVQFKQEPLKRATTAESKALTGLKKATSSSEDGLIAARPSVRTASSNIRLILSTAYRNRRTGDVYTFGDGRRMMIIPTNSSLADLQQESGKILKTQVLEVLVYENRQVVPFHSKHVLHSMDQIYAVLDPPPRSRLPCLRYHVFEAMNILYPTHELVCRNSEALSRDQTAFQKSAANVALICRNIALSTPVLDEGDMELRSQGKKQKAKIATGASGWAKVRGAVLDKSRPFFIYPWRKSLQIDSRVLFWMISLPLAVGLPICLLPFERDTELPVSEHRLYSLAGMCMLGLVTGLFLNAWLGFYFYIHMSLLSYLCVAICIPGLAFLVFRGLTTLTFPFYNSPVCVMLILTAAVFVLSYPHVPVRLKSKKKTFRKDISNCMIIINFLILVFIVNRLLVTNFGQRDAPSLITLSILYPVLVARSTDDCARLAEAFNRKTVSVVEAFFTFVSSVFQMIVFLGIQAKVNPLLVFVIINMTDMFCLFISGPLAAFLKKKNRRLLKHHQAAGQNEDGDDFGLESFIKWVKDPLKLKPLLIKCYCEVSAKFTFIILALVIRYGPSSKTESFPFIHDIDVGLFWEAIYFTGAEMTIWIGLQYGVEYYLRRKKCQYMLYKEKKNMRNIKSILGTTNTFITVFLLLQQTPASGA